MIFRLRIACWLLIPTIAFVLYKPARGQTTMEGLFAPWEDEHDVNGGGSLSLQNAGHVKGTGDGLHLVSVESQGRWRLSNGYELNPTVGYALQRVSFNSHSPVLPDTLTDLSVGIASPIKKFDTGWVLLGSAAVGYAGESAFGVGTGWYGRATVAMGKELDKDQTLVFDLGYDGNRTIYPDLLLPGVSYERRVNESLTFEIGIPNNSLTWRPRPDLLVDIHYSIPSSLVLTLGYRPVEQILFFADFRDTTFAFHMENYPPNQRLFFDDMRVEAGIRWRPHKQLSLVAAVGYAFSQELHRGFDTRDTESVARLSDEPYLRVGLEWKH